MFEQELYNAEPAEKPQEGDLFYNYERTNWDIGPRLYKILAFSAVLNLAVLGFIAQSDVLTRRGCDSPWVGRVCQVLDMAYVGSMLYGTERDFVDHEYDKIDLGDAEVTFIDVSNAEPMFQYPANYDQIANPEKLAALQLQPDQPLPAGFNSPLPTFPSSGGNLTAQKQELPKPNPSNNLDDLPDSPFATDETVSKASRKGRNGKLSGNRPASNSNSDTTVAQNNSNTNSNSSTPSTPRTSEEVLAVEINKRPIVDLANSINALREKGPLNLESEFTVTGKGRLDKTGKFDPKFFKFGPATGKEEVVVQVVKDSVEAINEAGYLQYLTEVVGKELSFVLQQNTDELKASFESVIDNESLAKTRKSSLDFLISLAKVKKQVENASQDDKDDLALLDSVKTEVVGKTLKITFTVPKGVAHPMIQRKLAEQAAELKKPNGQLTTKGPDTSAKR